MPDIRSFEFVSRSSDAAINCLPALNPEPNIWSLMPQLTPLTVTRLLHCALFWIDFIQQNLSLDYNFETTCFRTRIYIRMLTTFLENSIFSWRSAAENHHQMISDNATFCECRRLLRLGLLSRRAREPHVQYS